MKQVKVLERDSKGYLKTAEGGEFTMWYKSGTYSIENLLGKELLKTKNFVAAAKRFFELEGSGTVIYNKDGNPYRASDEYKDNPMDFIASSGDPMGIMEAVRHKAIKDYGNPGYWNMPGWRLARVNKTIGDEALRGDRIMVRPKDAYKWQGYSPRIGKLFSVDRDNIKILI